MGPSFPMHFTDENKGRVGDPSRAGNSPRDLWDNSVEIPAPACPSPSLTQKPSPVCLAWARAPYTWEPRSRSFIHPLLPKRTQTQG